MENEILVIEITILVEEKNGGGLTLPIVFLEKTNLVL
jgi:hypothetical protein